MGKKKRKGPSAAGKTQPRSEASDNGESKNVLQTETEATTTENPGRREEAAEICAGDGEVTLPSAGTEAEKDGESELAPSTPVETGPEEGAEPEEGEKGSEEPIDVDGTSTPPILTVAEPVPQIIGQDVVAGLANSVVGCFSPLQQELAEITAELK